MTYYIMSTLKSLSLVSRHLSKCLLQLLSDGFIFLLLRNQLILQSVNLFLEFLDRSLGKFSSSLGLLQFGGESLDLLLVAGLSLVSLVLGDLQRLEVGGDHSQFLLQLDNLHLSCLGSFLSSLQLRLNLLKSLLDLLILLVCLLCLVPGILQLLLKLSHSLFVLDSSVLKNFPHSVRIVSGSGSLVELVGGNEKFILALLKIFLQTLNPPVESIDFQLGGEKSVLFVLQLLGGELELLLGLVQLHLQLLRLLDELGHLLLSLGCSHFSVLGCLLTGIGPVHGVVLLHLHGLHLLLDGVHCC